MRKPRVTIKNIAEVVGLSYATVSRALNNHPRVHPNTRATIIKTAEEMGYRPNFHAKTLVKRKSNLIGLLVFDFRNSFYTELTRVIQDVAEDMGYWVIQANTDDNPEKTESLVNFMQNIGVDGIIFASPRLDDDLIERLIEDGFPVVMANRHLSKTVGDYVILDNRYGAYLAVMHLIHLGRRRIAMIKGSEYTSTSEERYQGYLDALQESNLPVDNELIKPGAFTQDSGHKWTRRLMRHQNPPDAILCGDDEIALGAIRALEEIGFTVPGHVAVVGFDDSNISSHPRIQLTTVSQDVQKMGMLVTDMMARRIENPAAEYEQIILQPNLIIRQSCGSHARNHALIKP